MGELNVGEYTSSDVRELYCSDDAHGKQLFYCRMTLSNARIVFQSYNQGSDLNLYVAANVHPYDKIMSILRAHKLN